MKYYATKKTRACLVILASFFASHVQAATIVLDFEGVGNLKSINNFYNGGTDSGGNSGINYGIQFSSASRGVTDTDNGGSGNFAHEPSGSSTLSFTSSNNLAETMNVAVGFETGFSFFYSSKSSSPIIISIFDGLNGTGTLLASLVLDKNYNNNDCEGDPNGIFCHWDSIGIAFNGIAKSVDFGGSTNKAFFDNLTLGSDIPAAVPVPGAIWLMGSSLLSLLKFRRKSQPQIAA